MHVQFSLGPLGEAPADLADQVVLADLADTAGLADSADPADRAEEVRLMAVPLVAAPADKGAQGGGGGQADRGAQADHLAARPWGLRRSAGGARLANCSTAFPTEHADFRFGIFKNDSGNYNIVFQAMLVDAAGGPPDSLAITQGAACDAAATSFLSLPIATTDWIVHSGWWLLHSEMRLDGFLENADPATLTTLLAAIPSIPDSAVTSTGGASGNRRKGMESGVQGRMLLFDLFKSLGKAVGGAKKKNQGGKKNSAKGSGNMGEPLTVTGYAVLAASSASGATWGAELKGVLVPEAPLAPIP
ncbi:unnamed protein product [Closterium sp. Naga37s-1]|nr:unnamed protein product [Closterium sp. Naga37s-1]